MRDILFRGKRIDNGEWVEGFYYKMAETTYYLIWRILQLPEIALIIQNYYGGREVMELLLKDHVMREIQEDRETSLRCYEDKPTRDIVNFLL